MKEQYKDTNLNFYIKVRLTEDGKKIYQEYYANYNCGAPGLKLDDEGYVEFQIYDFMHIFGKRLFMGAALPCATNCKIQVKDDWHYIKSEADLPKDNSEYLLLLEHGIRVFGYYNGKFWESWKGDLSWQEVRAYYDVPVPNEMSLNLKGE